MDKIYDVKDFKRTTRKAQAREWIQGKRNDFQIWFNRNKEMILVLGPTAIGATTALIKVVGKHVNLHKEQDIKELYCYDRSLGHYWALRRELSNREWIEIDKRKRNGERLADILCELKVLK